MANVVELDELVQRMLGEDSTNQWDVVASYSVIQLNAFLKAQYDAGKLAKTVVVEKEYRELLSPEVYIFRYTLLFASPVLSFIAGRSGFATLRMPIQEGSFVEIIKQETVQKTVPIPGDKYSVQAVVPLAAMKGGTGEVIDHENIVTFSDGNPQEAHIIVHFNSEKGTLFEIVPAPDPHDHDLLVTHLLPVLKNYFQTQVRSIEYALTAINNRRPESGATILTPRSFVFASTGDENDGGILSLYIQTAESGNPPGNPTPSFQPGDRAVDPIPKGYTASMILSHRLMTQSYLKPQLEAAGFSVELARPETGGGVLATLRKNENIIAVGDSGQSFFVDHRYEGLMINLHDNPIRMALQNGAITLDFIGSTLSSWHVHNPLSRTGGSYGGVFVGIWLHKGPIPLTLSNDDVIGTHVAVDRSEFHVELNAKGCSYWDMAMKGCSEDIPSYYYNELREQLQFPDFSLMMPGLDFFNTTNLLAPGEHVIELDTAAGVHTPHDFIVVGNVVSLARLRALRAGASAGVPST